MKDLITELEAASGGSRELDILIAVAVGHHEIRSSEYDGMSELWDVSEGREYLVGSEYQWHKFDGPFYTTSTDAALTIFVEGGHLVGLDFSPLTKGWNCSYQVGQKLSYAKNLPIPALAICIAALKARA